jgi:hypothetical protein
MTKTIGEKEMQFGNALTSNGQAALALVAGLIKVLSDVNALKPNELVTIFEHALKVAPNGDSDNRTDMEARQLIASLRREIVPESD